MDYVDFTVVRLADEATRADLFNQAALGELAACAYDADAMQLAGPYEAAFDELVVGLTVPRRATGDAHWGLVAGGDRREARWTALGLGGDLDVRVDALWRGALVARAAAPGARIAAATAAWPTGRGIDDEIAAALGGLPADPAALEAARRARMLARVRAGMRQPALLDDAAFDAWLRATGARSVGELIAPGHGIATAALGIELTPATTAPPAPRRLPVTAAILVRAAPLPVARLLADSKRVRDHLRALGAERAPAPATAPRHAVVVAWMVPEAAFDPDWPGGDAGSVASGPAARRAARRAAAARWLAREGISVITTPDHGAPP